MGKQYLNGVLYGTGEIIKFSPNIYSEEEREVGVWIDGKPLYQKTWEYRITSTISGGEHSLINFPNVNIIKLEAECFAPSSRACYPLPYTTADSYRRVTGIKYNNDYIKLDVYDDTWGTGYTILITAYYTKTTDTPGSGHYTTNGGEAHHYSLTEQVIGTWIDNRPLYERVFVFENSLSVQSSWTLTNIDSTNIRDVVNVIGIHEDGTCYNILCADPTQSNHTKIGLMAYRATSITQIKKVILQYTKTTD